ncbi:serine proteinase inhibitor 7 [Penaeus vannamei]|uniref:Serine proteinase inhibitor 7 n=1 Tax=Penaeus vannamei TaxID=6689 RepID=A0A3R7PV66_PENVA|nr:serine proteinase inhibitor 7 [Penaeus vannamei]
MCVSGGCGSGGGRAYSPTTTTLSKSTPTSRVTDFGFDFFDTTPLLLPQELLLLALQHLVGVHHRLYLGSGRDEAQLKRALRVGSKVGAFKIWRALDALYQTSNNDYTFNIVHRAYIDYELPIRPCISEVLSNEIERVDFRDALNTVNRINNFASTNTKGKINNLVTAGDLQDVQMALVNAAYFKGTWQSQFKPTTTAPERFFVTPQRHQMVPMMSQIAAFRYGESEQVAASVLELPYTGERVSMFLFLPDQEGPQGFANMVSRLSGNNLREAIHQENLRKKKVDLKLPKFRMELKLSDEMLPALMDMGIRDIFDSEKVDFTTLGNIRNLTLEKVIHKAFVEVNEEGTEAAAATALAISSKSLRRDFPVRFHCNRPFLFLIRDNETNNNLFMGVYRDPDTARS